MLTAALLLSLLPSCYYDVEEELYPAGDCDLSDVTYSTGVQPIIVSRCYKCHDQNTQQGGIVLEGHTNLKRYADNGRLLGAVRHDPGFQPMPQSEPQLPDCQIMIIEAWVEEGAPDN